MNIEETESVESILSEESDFSDTDAMTIRVNANQELTKKAERYPEEYLLFCYCKDCNYTIPTKEETRELEKKCACGTPESQRAARETLVTTNLRLVIHIALKFRRRHDISIMDLIQEGNLGLIKASQKFNPELGKFSNYAGGWITAAIKELIASSSSVIKVTSEAYDKNRRIAKLENQVLEEKILTDKDIAESLDKDIAWVNTYRYLFKEQVSLSSLTGNGDYLLRSENSIIEDSFFAQELESHFKGLMENLHKQNPLCAKMVTARHYSQKVNKGTDLPFETIADTYDTPRNTCRKLYKDGIKFLRDRIGHESSVYL